MFWEEITQNTQLLLMAASDGAEIGFCEVPTLILTYVFDADHCRGWDPNSVKI